MRAKQIPITPYVNVFNRTPQKGFSQFLDTPRYSTGYTSLWNSLGLMIETHMLKPYAERVNATLTMLKSLIEESSKHKNSIQLKRKQNFENTLNKKSYAFNFSVDSTQHQVFNFLGYEATQEKSNITQQTRLKYHANKPISYPVKYYNFFKAKDLVVIPKAYIIPKAYDELIQLLKLNNIEITQFENDSMIDVEVYRIQDYHTKTEPYEGHYLHYNTTVHQQVEKMKISQGDYYIKTNQKGIRYLLETLEPEAVDSFFNWNFFDSILQQKEGFSPYVFEDLAEQILQNNPHLKAEFERRKSKDDAFSENAYQQLNWIYKQSKYYENAHLRYPIYRILQ